MIKSSTVGVSSAGAAFIGKNLKNLHVGWKPGEFIMRRNQKIRKEKTHICKEMEVRVEHKALWAAEVESGAMRCKIITVFYVCDADGFCRAVAGL